MDNRTPAHTIRFGRIKATIWANDGMNGQWHSVQISRTYTEGGDWKQTDSLGRNDLLLACKALDQAHTWIYEQANSGRADRGMNGTMGNVNAEEGQGLPV